MTRRIALAAIAVLVTISLAGCFGAVRKPIEAYNTVAGSILDQNGKPIQQPVRLYYADGRFIGTFNGGAFGVRLPDGDFELVATSPGYYNSTPYPVTSATGNTFTANITLRQWEQSEIKKLDENLPEGSSSSTSMERQPWVSGDTVYFFGDSYDIYESTWNDSTGEWSPPKIALVGVLDEGTQQEKSPNLVSPVVLKGGTVMYVMASDGSSYQAYRIERPNTTAPWPKLTSNDRVEGLRAQNYGMNLWVSEDESLAYVVSKDGNRDIYRCENVGGEWQPLEKLGSNINTGSDEYTVFQDAEGRLYFSSDKFYIAEELNSASYSFDTLNQWYATKNAGYFINEDWVFFDSGSKLYYIKLP